MVSAVYRGDEAKPSVQTCTCVHCTCNRYGVTGDRYGVRQSHPWCDPCYTLHTSLAVNLITPSLALLACLAMRHIASLTSGEAGGVVGLYPLLLPYHVMYHVTPP